MIKVIGEYLHISSQVCLYTLLGIYRCVLLLNWLLVESEFYKVAVTLVFVTGNVVKFYGNYSTPK